AAATPEDGTGLPPLLPVPVAPAAPPAAVIEVPEYLRYPHRGETPMMHTWNRLGLSALLAAALAAGPARGQEVFQPGNTDTGDKTDTILDQLKTLSQSVKDLGPLKDVPQRLAELDRKISEALADLEKNSTLRMNAVQRDLQTLREQYAQLKQELDALRG